MANNIVVTISDKLKSEILLLKPGKVEPEVHYVACIIPNLVELFLNQQVNSSINKNKKKHTLSSISALNGIYSN